jgi:hypothetical protein
MQTIDGGCWCGKVRFHVSAAPLVTRVCWCRVCQYVAAGNGSVNLVFPVEAVQIEGETRDYSTRADSGNVMHRQFCPTCGTHLFSAAESRPHLLIVRMGTLDDREPFAPQGNIWTASAPSWACMDQTLEAFEGQPPAPAPK